MIEYIPFTRRVPVTQEFIPGDDEHILYERVSAYLQRETLIALPASQRQLITLVLRKLLASSTFAIEMCIRDRLQTISIGPLPNHLRPATLSDETRQKVRLEKSDANKVVVAQVLDAPHPLVERTDRGLRSSVANKAVSYTHLNPR